MHLSRLANTRSPLTNTGRQSVSVWCDYHPGTQILRPFRSTDKVFPEADALAALLTPAGRADAAQSLIERHGRSDEPGEN